MSRAVVKPPPHYGQRLIAALRYAGWIAHEATANHTVFIREDYARTDSGGMRRLFIGHHSGQCSTGESWGYATPLPSDWPDRIIARYDAARQGCGVGQPSAPARPAKPLGPQAAARARALLKEIGI